MYSISNGGALTTPVRLTAYQFNEFDHRIDDCSRRNQEFGDFLQNGKSFLFPHPRSPFHLVCLYYNLLLEELQLLKVDFIHFYVDFFLPLV